MATSTSYYMRAQDSGTGSWVYWSTTDPSATPSASITTPSYTGTLSNFQVVFSLLQPIVQQGFGGLIINKFTPAGMVGPTDPVLTGTILIVDQFQGVKFTKFQPGIGIFKPAFIPSDVLVFTGSAVRVS